MKTLYLRILEPLLKLEEVRLMIFDKHGIYEHLSKSCHGFWETHIVVNKSFKSSNINTLEIRKLYQSPPGIKPAKVNNIRELIRYLVTLKIVQREKWPIVISCVRRWYT